MISLSFFCFLLTFVVVTSLVQPIITTSASCLPHERRALLHFKQQLIAAGDPAHLYNYWLSSWANSTSEAAVLDDDCCQWKGVTCDHDSAHSFVTGIHLNNCYRFEHLKILGKYEYEHEYGNVPDGPELNRKMKPEALLALAALSHLSHLDLGCQGFHGSIPAEIANLTSLAFLNLTRNFFSFMLMESLGNLTLLQHLDLSYNLHLQYLSPAEDWSPSFQLQTLDLSGGDFNGGFPPWLRYQSNLSILSLAGNRFSGEIPSWAWPLATHSLDFSGNDFSHTFTCDASVPSPLPSLVDLVISNNPRFSGTFPCFIANLTSLQTLDFGSNSLTGSIPADLFANTLSLTDVDLSDNQLEGRIPSSLLQLPSLLSLNLISNHFTGAIPDVLMNLTLLKELYLSDNHLNGLLPRSMQHLESLQRLLMDENDFDAQVIPFFLLQLPSLVVLGLSSNNFIGPIADVFTNLTNMEFLQALLLSSNSITGPLPDAFRNLTKLGFLDLSDNQLGQLIPSSMRYLNSLETLKLSDNLFDPQEIPSFVLQLPSLLCLDLSSNNFTGPIPDVFTNLTQLSILDLSRNLLNGLLPPSMLCLKSVQELHLQNNRFPPQKISSSVLLLPSLRYLDLSFNKFTGLTSQIDKHNASFCEKKGTSRLRYLYLASNKLTSFLYGGESCLLLLLLQNLAVLDMSSNQLQIQGLFPATLGHSKPNLVILNMNNNRLRGPIPNFIRFLENIQLLDLGSNQLDGSIPEWIGPNLSQLRILVLAQNSLTGILPASLSLLPAMQNNANQSFLKYELIAGVKVMDIYDSFSIPISVKGQMRTISDAQFFSVLDLSSNRLSGSIPQEIGKLKGLQFLNLSNNLLHGKIPSTVGDLTNLESLDLSRNMLHGHIPESFDDLQDLGFVNLSRNHLSGSIPSSLHWLDTFDETSFEDNDGLCTVNPKALARLPLCSSSYVLGYSSTATDTPKSTDGSFLEEAVEWRGFVVGYLSGLMLGVIAIHFILHHN